VTQKQVVVHTPAAPQPSGSLCVAILSILCAPVPTPSSRTNYTVVTISDVETLCLNVLSCAAASDSGGKGQEESHDACSFTATMDVATKEGERPLGSLHEGDKVWAYNPQTRKMELQSIKHVWVNHDDDLIDLTITSTHSTRNGTSEQSKSEVIHTNQKHPFLTTEKGFVAVRDLHVGMHVRKADGSLGVITAWRVIPGVSVMYNLEVTQDHTFTVGEGQWVVHNCGGDAASGQPERLKPPSIPDGMTQSDFGKKVMQWGTGSDVPRMRMGTVTRAEMERAGVTQQMAKEWRDFYHNETRRNPSNPSAPGRADLMDYVYRLLHGKDE